MADSTVTPAAPPATMAAELREELTRRQWVPWGGPDLLTPAARGRASRGDGVQVEILDGLDEEPYPVSVFLPGAGQTVLCGRTLPLDVVLAVIDAAIAHHQNGDRS